MSDQSDHHEDLPAHPDPGVPDEGAGVAGGADLHERDAAALEALLESGLDPERTPEPHRARARHVARVLGLLNPGHPACPDALADVTLARLSRAEAHCGSADMDLHDDDAEALDALVRSGFRVSRVPSSLRARAQRLESIGALLTAGGPALPAGLTDRTLAAIAATPSRRRARDEAPADRGGRWRLADAISVLAVCLMGAAILWPAMAALRNSQRATQCRANLGALASAFTRYSGDYRGTLPVAASFAGPTWWNTGRDPGASNSANLFTLARLGYEPLPTLACAGNPWACRDERPNPDARDWRDLDEVSYSYFVVFGPRRPSWETSERTIVLADRSPVVRRALAGQVIHPLENSANHGGRGQFVLRADGSSGWLASPVDGSDNIWLPASIESVLRESQERLGAGVVRVQLTGREFPDHEADSLLGP